MLHLCVTTIVSYFAPPVHKPIQSLHKNKNKTTFAVRYKCAGSQVRFGILKMAVAVRSAIYLYLRIEGELDPCIELFRLRFLQIYQTIAKLRNPTITVTV